jgi:hypothetical protein
MYCRCGGLGRHSLELEPRATSRQRPHQVGMTARRHMVHCDEHVSKFKCIIYFFISSVFVTWHVDYHYSLIVLNVI